MEETKDQRILQLEAQISELTQLYNEKCKSWNKLARKRSTQWVELQKNYNELCEKYDKVKYAAIYYIGKEVEKLEKAKKRAPKRKHEFLDYLILDLYTQVGLEKHQKL